MHAGESGGVSVLKTAQTPSLVSYTQREKSEMPRAKDSTIHTGWVWVFLERKVNADPRAVANILTEWPPRERAVP